MMEDMVMIESLPDTIDRLAAWTWTEIEPHYQALEAATLNAGAVDAWLSRWSRLSEHVSEMRERLYVATTVNTADTQATQRFNAFLDTIQPNADAAEQKLKEKLLASGLEPAGFAMPLRNIRTEAAIFRQENLPLQVEEDKMANEYDQIAGAQTVVWEGEELTVNRLARVYQEADRGKRERAWRLGMERWLKDRPAINALWRRFLTLRRRMAANAGFGDDYRAYRWQQLLRFDYAPTDCRTFHEAIAEVAVPAASRVYERRRRRLGVATLRPWDLDVDPFGLPPLRPFRTDDELKTKGSAIFHKVDAQFGAYFDIMRGEGLLDLENRKGKAPGGYCDEFAAAKRPFIFMNAVGMHDDVQTLLHEGGHSFHVFESSKLPYLRQQHVGMEFAEVASMAMELLASPYLTGVGGFYSKQDAARARIEHMERVITFWPYMAVVDAFQHWVYENPDAALDPAQCDAEWGRQRRRFMPGVDWSDLEESDMTGWQRKLHIHQRPFYYIEYGLAQVGAAQVWANALRDQAGATAAYRHALALGGTVSLPDLYRAAGAEFAFDAGTLGAAVRLLESVIGELDATS
jgi:oligoendopeptidase F